MLKLRTLTGQEYANVQCEYVSVIIQGVVKGCGLPLVAGSVGPYGACLHDGSEYTGDYVDHMTKEVSHVNSTPHMVDC